MPFANIIAWKDANSISKERKFSYTTLVDNLPSDLDRYWADDVPANPYMDTVGNMTSNRKGTIHDNWSDLTIPEIENNVYSVSRCACNTTATAANEEVSQSDIPKVQTKSQRLRYKARQKINDVVEKTKLKLIHIVAVLAQLKKNDIKPTQYCC